MVYTICAKIDRERRGISNPKKKEERGWEGGVDMARSLVRVKAQMGMRARGRVRVRVRVRVRGGLG